jgi:hypothetical protein
MQVLAGDPQQHRRLDESLVDIEVGTVQGDAALALGRAYKEGLGELAREFLRGH